MERGAHPDLDKSQFEISYDDSTTDPYSTELSLQPAQAVEETDKFWRVPLSEYAESNRGYEEIRRYIETTEDMQGLKNFLLKYFKRLKWGDFLRDQLLALVKEYAPSHFTFNDDMDPSTLLGMLGDILDHLHRKLALFDVSVEGSDLLEGTALQMAVDESREKISKLIEAYNKRLKDAEENVYVLNTLLQEDDRLLKEKDQKIDHLYRTILNIEDKMTAGQTPEVANIFAQLKEILENDLHYYNTFREELSVEKREKHRLFQELCKLKESLILSEQEKLQDVAEIAKDFEMEEALVRAITQKIQGMRPKSKDINKVVTLWMNEANKILQSRQQEITHLLNRAKLVDVELGKCRRDMQEKDKQHNELRDKMMEMDAKINEKLKTFKLKQKEIRKLDEEIKALEYSMAQFHTPKMHYGARSIRQPVFESPEIRSETYGTPSFRSFDETFPKTPEIYSTPLGRTPKIPPRKPPRKPISSADVHSAPTLRDTQDAYLESLDPTYSSIPFIDEDTPSSSSIRRDRTFRESPQRIKRKYVSSTPIPFSMHSPEFRDSPDLRLYSSSSSFDESPGKLRKGSPYSPVRYLDDSSPISIDSTPHSPVSSHSVTPPSPYDIHSPLTQSYDQRRAITFGTQTLSGPSRITTRTTSVDPSTQSIPQVSNRFDVGKSFNMRTTCRPSAPYQQVTSLSSLIPESGESSRMVDSPFSIRHRAELTPTQYQTPFISKSRFGYTDPTAKVLNLPPGDDIIIPTALRGTSSKSPKYTEIQISHPKPEWQGVSPVYTFGTPPAVTPTTARRHGLFTPRGIFRKRHYNIRKLFPEEEYESPEPHTKYSEKSVTWPDSPYPHRRNIMDKTFDASPVMPKSFKSATPDTLDRTFDASSPISMDKTLVESYPTALDKTFQASSQYAMNKTFGASSPIAMNRTFDVSPPTAMYKTFRESPGYMKRTYDESPPTTMDITFRESPGYNKRTYDESPPTTIDRTFRESPVYMNRTYDESPPTAMDKTFRESPGYMKRIFHESPPTTMDRAFYESPPYAMDRRFDTESPTVMDSTFQESP